jgi:hypothetical protein
MHSTAIYENNRETCVLTGAELSVETNQPKIHEKIKTISNIKPASMKSPATNIKCQSEPYILLNI